MRNTKQQPKFVSSLDIISIILAGFLMLTFSGPFSKIGTLRDWCFYDNYIETLANTKASNSSEKFNSIASDTIGRKKKHSNTGYNITDASAESVALINEAKDLIHPKLGNQSTLHWEHFDNIQIKECDIDNVGLSVILAYYEPKDNTIYCNRAVMNDNSWSRNTRLHTVVHELMHSLLEQDNSAFEGGVGAFHEGFTEYLAQLVCPTNEPSYYLCFCLAEVFAEDNGLDKAIELFMAGQAEESINQRLHRENLVQNIDFPLYMGSYYPTSKDNDPIILDVYLHYVQVTGIYHEDHIDGAISRIYPSYENLATIIYFNSLRQQITTRRDI